MSVPNHRLLSTLVVMQLLTLGILVAMYFNPPEQNPTVVYRNEAASGNPALVSETHPAPVATAELKKALREIIREELAALPSPSRIAKDDSASQPEEALSEHNRQEQETAAAISTSIVQQATSAGVWTRADTEALLPQIARLSEEQRVALMEQLYGAINRQEMDIQDFPPL